MHFTSALTSLLLASSAAALPTTNGTSLETRGALNLTQPALFARSGNYTNFPIVPRWNTNSTVFPRLALNKNSTEGIFDKRDVVEGVALPTGVVGKRNASPTGYVKRSFGTGTPFQA
ncbi:hypothetical protein MPH_13029 [Macrophomina phaseolina MS6]|uniref:Uncharacterized protein n=1 Tax=Macrophomina phaseolina (strain MS6) TaxID=1126212 RepID=K2RAB6_MACPH|nr:hypothetical protein MPH_13029 [Macrophomina phaseolina MS6]